jgi:histidine triad (HIT) family protein
VSESGQSEAAPRADCLFCAIVAGDIPATVVHRSDRVVAFRDIDPKAPTHILVIPTTHLPDAAAVVAHDPGLLGELAGVAAELAAADNVAEAGYRMVLNTGKHGGQTVFHAHLHLLGGRQLTWPPG